MFKKTTADICNKFVADLEAIREKQLTIQQRASDKAERFNKEAAKAKLEASTASNAVENIRKLFGQPSDS